MPTLRGRIWDRDLSRPLEARVQIVTSGGQLAAPADAIHKVGTGEPFFYSDGSFEVGLPSGPTDILVERGTEYRPTRLTVAVPRHGTIDVDLPLERWIRLADQGWHAGNTHVHYDEKESRPLDRLRLDPRVEDLPVLVVSVLQRWQLAYASNAFPIGHHEASTPDHVIKVGEESRHNEEPWQIGYGHIMLLNIDRLVEPMSRGVLVDEVAPDYPPLIDACDGAHEQGGVVLWCHHAEGMEAPVAAALGRLDGINLFDPFWRDPDYDVWYRLLNCGLRLPCSTGSDWFVCSSNRVYTEAGAEFSYEGWLAALRDGRTFITDGPILRLSVAGHGPSNDVLDLAQTTGQVEVAVEWESAQPIDRIEIVRDGEIVAGLANADGSLRGRFTASVDATDGGWIAARCWGDRRTSYGHPLWGHTSPVYLRARPGRATVQAAALDFEAHIDRAREWIATRGRFDSPVHRDRLLQLYAEGRAAFTGLTRT